MAEKDKVYGGKINHTGIFNFKDYYSFASNWLKQEGYNLVEKKYAEEITGDTKKLEIVWEAKKKISDYFKFVIKITIMPFNLKSVEIQREGKKIKTNQGGIEIRMQAILVKDYEHKWEDRPIWKFLRGIYDRYIITSRISSYENKLKEEIEEFSAQTKSFLVLEAK